MERIAIITLTRQGIFLGKRLLQAIPSAHLYLPDKYGVIERERISSFDGNLRTLLQVIFHQYTGFVFVMATGIVVRIIADYIRDKKFDPAVVVMDITGKFAISLVSGHLGGANELARQVAEITGAIPVVTTGTDVNETIAPDLLAKEIGGEVDDFEAMKKVSAALVDGELVGVVNESGIKLKSLEGPLRENVIKLQCLSDLEGKSFKAAIVITHRLLDAKEIPAGVAWVAIRPKDLVVGIGCNRGTSAEEIEAVVKDVLERERLSLKSVRNLATVDLKGDEPGLCVFAQKAGLLLALFPREALNAVEDLPSPSEASKYIGAKGVAEPAALLSARAKSLLVPKRKSGNVTVAVAKVPPSEAEAP